MREMGVTTQLLHACRSTEFGNVSGNEFMPEGFGKMDGLVVEAGAA